MIENAKYMHTGGGCYSISGKLSNGNWFFTDPDELIYECDADVDQYNEILNKGLDSRKWERKHIIKHYKDDELLEEMKRWCNLNI